MNDTAQHVTDMRDVDGNVIANVVTRTDPLADHHRKIWADHDDGSILLGYAVDDPTLLAGYKADRVVWSEDPLYTTKIRQMYYRTF